MRARGVDIQTSPTQRSAWALKRDGEQVQLTRLNQPLSMRRRAMVRDYSWGPRGREIAIYSVILVWGEKPRHAIEILELNGEF